jgi:hypothetical protein
MDTTLTVLAVEGGRPLVGIAPLIFGILLVAGMIVARVLYMRRKRQEPPVPSERRPRSGAWETVEEHGLLRPKNDHGPGHQDGPVPVEYENVTREPEEVFGVQAEPLATASEAEEPSGATEARAEEISTGRRHPARRLTPHELRHYPGPRT